MTPKDKLKLAKAAALDSQGQLILMQEIESVGEEVAKLQEYLGSLEQTVAHIGDALKKKLESELVLEIDKEELKGDQGEQGPAGETYNLTEADKKDIASKIDVPVVEKIIKETTIIKEQPIVTEKVVQVAVGDNPDAIVEKINSIPDDGLKINFHRIDGLPELEQLVLSGNKTTKASTVGWGAHPLTVQQSGVTKSKVTRFLNFTGATVSQNASGVVTVAVTGGGVGAWSTPAESPAADGSVLQFTVGTSAPTDVVGDSSMRFLGIDYTYSSPKITFLANSAPTQSVRYR